MLTTFAVAGYRSLRDLALSLGALTVITGLNGSGKSNLYRAMRLLAQTATGSLIAAVAREGGDVRVVDGFGSTEGGVAIAGEVWRLPAAGFGRFVADLPQPMGIGRVTLADGREVAGFLCERVALENAEDITAYGGWRAYRAAQA